MPLTGRLVREHLITELGHSPMPLSFVSLDRVNYRAVV